MVESINIDLEEVQREGEGDGSGVNSQKNPEKRYEQYFFLSHHSQRRAAKIPAKNAIPNHKLERKYI